MRREVGKQAAPVLPRRENRGRRLEAMIRAQAQERRHGATWIARPFDVMSPAVESLMTHCA